MPVIGKDDTPSTEVSVPSSGPTSLLVHVAGRVAHPGLVRLTQGSRVADAVAAAGGPVDGADVDSLNLAAPLADGQRVYVPALGEVVDPTQGVGGSSGPVVRIDLNSATADQFDALPGIGPSLAAALVSYRTEHGPFRSVDDLLNVPGIGASKLDRFRSLVRV